MNISRPIILALLLATPLSAAMAQEFTGAPPRYPPLLPHISLGSDAPRHLRHHRMVRHRVHRYGDHRAV